LPKGFIMSRSFALALPRADALPRRLTILFAAAAIALAGLGATARPAKADVEDLLRFLAGAVVVAAIVNAIDDNHTPHYYSRYELPDSCLETMRIDWRNVQSYNAHCLRRGGYTNLPNRCRYEFRVSGYNSRTGYLAECMWESGYRRGSGFTYHEPPIASGRHPSYPQPSYHDVLPQHCAMTYREAGSRRHGYWGHCLNTAGFHNLPRECRRTTTDGSHLYNRRCLSDAGYRTGR
jgi:hypothetical protein